MKQYKGWEIVKMISEGAIKDGDVVTVIDTQNYKKIDFICTKGDLYSERYQLWFRGIGWCFYQQLKFELKEREYSTEQAFKFLQDGKVIKSCVSKISFTLIDNVLFAYYNNLIKNCPHYSCNEEVFSLDEILGKWTVYENEHKEL